MNAFERIAGVFHEPKVVFNDIAQRPTFMAALIVVIAFSMLSSGFTVYRLGGFEEMSRKQLDSIGRSNGMNMGGADHVQTTANINRVRVYATPVLYACYVAVLGGVLLLGNWLFGGTATYRQLFAVASHAQLPSVIAAMLVIIVVALRDPSDLDPQRIAVTNLGFFVEAGSNKTLHRLLASLDVFTFWQIFLLGTGASEAAGIGRVKGLVVAFLPWCAYTATLVLLASYG